MKISKIVKLVLVIFISINFVSCGSDDNGDTLTQGPISEIKMTVDGTELIFDTIELDEYRPGVREFVATIENDSTKRLYLSIIKDYNNIGGNVFRSFLYHNDRMLYGGPNGLLREFNSFVTVHTDSTLVANFSGILNHRYSNNDISIAITKGFVNLSY